MATKTVSEARAEFDRVRGVLDELAEYASGKRAAVPSDVSELTERGRELLAQPSGRDIARSWASIFGETIQLVDKFYENELVRRRRVDEDEVRKVTRAASRTVTALTERLNRLA